MSSEKALITVKGVKDAVIRFYLPEKYWLPDGSYDVSPILAQGYEYVFFIDKDCTRNTILIGAYHTDEDTPYYEVEVLHEHMETLREIEQRHNRRKEKK